MRYLLLLYDEDPDRSLGMTPEEVAEARAAVMPQWLELFGYLEQHARSTDGVELEHPQSAKTLRPGDGEWLVTDGPFAETKEQLAGVLFIECDDLDQAIEVAARVPLAQRGAVEIRPVAG